MLYFLGGKTYDAFGQPACFLAGDRVAIVALRKKISRTNFQPHFIVKRLCDSSSFHCSERELSC